MSSPCLRTDRVEAQHLATAIDLLGVSGADLCIHSSMRSFGVPVVGGAEALIDAFLQKGCTVMAPTFTYDHQAVPPQALIPPRNGMEDYETLVRGDTLPHKHFSLQSTDLSAKDMGLLPTRMLQHPDHVRGNNALNSFTAIGPHAQMLLAGQTNKNVYDPFCRLIENGGYVLMMGVGLTHCTLIHHAELLSGREAFVRWAYDEEDRVFPVATGSCSEAFDRFEEELRPFARAVTVAGSRWVCYRAEDIVRICTDRIRREPFITHCGDIHCTRCPDAVAGGPILTEGFWNGAK